jgi:glycosyltransferase involved in cell wall biosynthesis
MKRIYFDSQFLGRTGGIGADSRAILQLLLTSGYEVERGIPNKRAFTLPAKLLRRIRLGQAVKFLPYLLRRVETGDFDIHFSSQIGSSPPDRAFKGIWYVRVHDIFPLTNPEWFHPWSVKAFQKGIGDLKRLQPVLLFNSQATLETFRHRFPEYGKEKLFLFPCLNTNFKDLTLCLRCAACTVELSSRKYLTAIGTIEPRKNYQHLLSSYVNSNSNLELFIIGNYGWKSRKVRQLLNDTKGVTWFEGVCSAGLVRVLSKSYAFISDSIDEGFNLPIIEARTFNIPLILSDIGVHREFHNNQGMFFSHNELVSILAKLDNLELQRPDSVPEAPRNLIEIFR